MKEGTFSLQTLRDREIEYGQSFVCDGGKEVCDRHCTVARLKIDGRTYPFGGACNRWYNIRSHIKVDTKALNDVTHYERLAFQPSETTVAGVSDKSPSIGINKSFMVNTYAPLYRTNTKEGLIETPVRLANFTATITEQISEDDGNETIQKYRLEGSCGARQLPQIEILASQFSGMGWIHQWGSRTIIEPGNTIRDTVRHAIQVMSKNTLYTGTYTHTGWRKINENMFFLSHGSAIGGDNVDVQLAKETARYSIPAVPEEEILAIKTSLSFLDIGNRDVTLPLLTAAYIAPLTSLFSDFQPMNFSFYSYGQTGTFKTTLAVLVLGHFGNFNATSLPNLEDTANSVERKAFILKDVLMVLDDYHPGSQRKDAQSKEALVQRIIRAFSNRTGRGAAQ